jgi:hypothetical protein
MPEDSKLAGGLSSAQRRQLFLEMAGRPGGTTTREVYERAQTLGDGATEEAYHNIARRLAHRAQVAALSAAGSPTRYELRTGQETEQWLEESELAQLVDPDYPLVALTVWRESAQQVNDLPEDLWSELRERLRGEDARDLFLRAIISYCDDFHAQVADLAAMGSSGEDFSSRRREAENSLRHLVSLTKYGLGLSAEAVSLQANLDFALSGYLAAPTAQYYDREVLAAELELRIEPGPMVTDAKPGPSDRPLLVGAVDGSSRGGLLSISGEHGDFNLAHAPLVSINTAVGQINRVLETGGRKRNLFVRLPERPEDMQRQDNRHTVMAKLLHPDLSDAQYMHSVWNAMDLVEVRATQRLLSRWYTEDLKVEVPPADVVLRDGTASPQDRDFTHYKEQNSYGQIVRDLIETSWDVALRAREEGRTVCGVVKNSQLRFYGPIINWYACQLAGTPDSQITAWPLETMNALPDQLLITRLLTAGRQRGEEWTRMCLVLRPFHALTNFAKAYRRFDPPAEQILRRYDESVTGHDHLDQEERAFWFGFQQDADPFVKMLRQVRYGSTFVAPVPRLDYDNMLPRLELLISAPTADDGGTLSWPTATRHLQKVVDAFDQMGFDVSSEHSMFLSEPKLDVLPRLLIKAHDTVKVWAAELLGRVQEYVGYHLARYAKGKRLLGVKVRPFTRAELQALHAQLRAERERRAGGGRMEL